MKINKTASQFHAANLLKENIQDITLHSWIIDHIERGMGYDLKKIVRNWCKCFEVDCCQFFGTFKRFSIAMICSMLDYLDLFKDLTLVLILLHISKEILVREGLRLQFFLIVIIAQQT